MAVGDGTLLDPLQAAANAMLCMYDIPDCDYYSCKDVLLAGAMAAEEAATKTKFIHYPDPGAYAIGIIFRALYNTAKTNTRSGV